MKSKFIFGILFIFAEVTSAQPTFTEHVISTSADGARYVHAADMDGDGDMDVLSASSEDNKIALYLNDGILDTDITPVVEIVISTEADGAVFVHAADVDSDGDMDILSASYSVMTWWENDGSQGFTEQNTITADGSSSYFVADVDGDGDVDVLAS
ncbi:uncharacterized protein METZ01_LOCUS428685, partial [marine metagenome]